MAVMFLRTDTDTTGSHLVAALSGHNDALHIRAVRQAELPLLRDIERAAGQPFRALDMPEIADDEPLPVEVLAGYHRAGLAWVTTDTADTAVGYLIADRVDGNLHVEQVSIHPSHARRGAGRALIDHLADHARAVAVPALTLTTFADVPWNGPYYQRCGFVAVDDEELTPGLRVIRQREAVRGLDRWPRLCMRRDL